MTQRGNDVSNMCRFVPKLTVNGQFMRDFMAEESPCFALGLVEERKQLCGFLALRPAKVIPPEISGLGFNFGHALLGTTEFEVIQFVFHFNGFETYNMLVNPNNRLVKKVLMRMVESGDYFFFAISPNQSVTAFRSEIGQKNVAGLSARNGSAGSESILASCEPLSRCRPRGGEGGVGKRSGHRQVATLTFAINAQAVPNGDSKGKSAS